MPRGDGTGPMGMGSMTGRGAGYCAGLAVPGARNAPGMFGGFGCRRGAGGKMRGAGFQANEKELLVQQMNLLEKQLQEVKKRLDSFTTAGE